MSNVKTSVETISKEIDELVIEKIDKRKEDINRTESIISEKENNAKDLQDKLSQLSVDGSDSDYMKAYHNLEDIKKMIEVYHKRLSDLEEKPLATEEEQSEMKDKVNSVFNKLRSDTVKLLSELSEQMYNISKEFDNKTSVLNNAYIKYQREICHKYDGDFCNGYDVSQWGISTLIDNSDLYTEGVGKVFVPRSAQTPYEGDFVTVDEWNEMKRKKEIEEQKWRESLRKRFDQDDNNEKPDDEMRVKA